MPDRVMDRNGVEGRHVISERWSECPLARLRVIIMETLLVGLWESKGVQESIVDSERLEN